MGHIPIMDLAGASLAFIDGLGGPEMVLVFVVVLMLFGGQKLPEFARGLGKTIREFKKAAAGVEDEFKRALDEDERKNTAAAVTPAITSPNVASANSTDSTDTTDYGYGDSYSDGGPSTDPSNPNASSPTEASATGDTTTEGTSASPEAVPEVQDEAGPGEIEPPAVDDTERKPETAPAPTESASSAAPQSDAGEPKKEPAAPPPAATNQPSP